MTMYVTCPKCEREQQILTEAVGKALRCRFCGVRFRAGTAAEPEAGEQPAATEDSTAEPETFALADEVRPAASDARRPPSSLSAGQEPRPRTASRVGRYDADGAPPRRRQIGAPILLLIIFGGLALLGGVGYLGYTVLMRFRSIDASAWQDFAPPQGDCTVQMPGVPTTDSNTPTGPGILSSKKYTLHITRPETIFVLAYLDISPEVMRRMPFEELVRAERDHMLATTKGVLAGESATQLSGTNGREFQIKASTGRGLMIQRIIPVRRANFTRIYLLLAGGDFMEASAGDSQKFFDSFKLLSGGQPDPAGVEKKTPAVPSGGPFKDGGKVK